MVMLRAAGRVQKLLKERLYIPAELLLRAYFSEIGHYHLVDSSVIESICPQ